MSSGSRRPGAVLFDCDGVLADSEGLVNHLVAADLTARGWPMSPAEARDTFLGMALPDIVPMVAARLGRIPADWGQALAAAIGDALVAEVEAIPGARDAVRAVIAAGIPVAVASNSSRSELAAKLARLDLTRAFAGRAFSFEDVARPKPAPDIYRAAARSCGADPAQCVVVEDSLLGAKAGLAAGCRVLGLTLETDAAVFRAMGAEPFAAMADLPALLGLCE